MPKVLVVEVDSDWAGDPYDRKSVSSGKIFFGGVMLVSWTRRQGVISLSSGEAEFYAIGTGSCEGLYIQSILNELLNRHFKLVMYTDSTAARGMVLRRGIGKQRHMDIKHLFIQDLVQNKKLEVLKQKTRDNRADMGTKHLDGPTLNRLMLASGYIINPYKEEDQAGGVDGDAETNEIDATVSNLGFHAPRARAFLLTLLSTLATG